MAEEKKKSWFGRHKILTGFGIFILFIIGVSALGGADDTSTKVGSDDSSSAEEEKTVYKVGDTITFDGKEVTVSDIERKWNSGNEFVAPETDNEFVRAKVTIKNNSDSEAPYNTFDWKIQNSDGVIKDISTAQFSADGALDSGELAPGGKVSGFLIFETPDADSDLTIRYEPSFWSDKKIEIKLQ